MGLVKTHELNILEEGLNRAKSESWKHARRAVWVICSEHEGKGEKWFREVAREQIREDPV
jgi:hypothetical protein